VVVLDAIGVVVLWTVSALARSRNDPLSAAVVRLVGGVCLKCSVVLYVVVEFVWSSLSGTAESGRPVTGGAAAPRASVSPS
jgi:hypothetical protein